MSSKFRCISCGREYPVDNRTRCRCGDLLEVDHDWPDLEKDVFDNRGSSSSYPYNSGVWRFKELVYNGIPPEVIVSRPEGNTNLYRHRNLQDYVGLRHISLKHEGENPTGSFKDRGMTVGVSEAKRLGVRIVACASTGNTSSSLAAYAAQANLKCIVFVPEGKVSFGKLAQTISYGARMVQVNGDFDNAMVMVEQASEKWGLYLLNSINPWRIEGQKTIMFELLQQRGWDPPDWIVFPAGNLGNTSAFGKALREIREMGFIQDTPRLAAVQAEGASPFYNLWLEGGQSLKPVLEPETVASAIRIGAPVSWRKAMRAIRWTEGVVLRVSDQEIMDAKAVVDRSGIGCEPASAASAAGAKELVNTGTIDGGEEVVCVLTGALLKDPDATVQYHMGNMENIRPRFANRPTTVKPDLESIADVVTSFLD